MYKLEHGNKDESTAKRVAPVLGRLMNRNEEKWKDDFAANAALRSKFRVRIATKFMTLLPDLYKNFHRF